MAAHLQRLKPYRWLLLLLAGAIIVHEGWGYDILQLMQYTIGCLMGFVMGMMLIRMLGARR